MDIRTQKQKERGVRDCKVAAAYDRLKKEHPEAKASRLIETLAQSEIEGLTSTFGVRTALKRTGRI